MMGAQARGMLAMLSGLLATKRVGCWLLRRTAAKLSQVAISAHRCHRSGIPFQVALLPGSRVAVAIRSHSAARFRNSSCEAK